MALWGAYLNPDWCFIIKTHSEQLVTGDNELDRQTDSDMYNHCVIMHSAAAPINPLYKTVR